jgi:WD40 repeat protein
MRISAELRERTAKEKRPKSWINSVAANRDFVAAGHQSGAIWLWDRHLGRQITEIDTDLFCSFNDVGDYVSALALSDDNLLAVGTIHGRVYLWDLNSLRRADTMNYDLITPTDGFHSQRITLFTILPAHIVSVSADNRVLLWDRLKGRPLGTVYGSEISTDGMPVMIDPIVHKNEETNQWSVIYPPFPLDFAEPLARGLGSTPIEVILKHDGLYARCVQGIARIAWA